MKHNFNSILRDKFVEGVDYEFETLPKRYENCIWLNESYTEEQFEQWIVEYNARDQLAYVRQERNKLLEKTDWRFRSDLTPSQEWIDYCQQLRDITNDTSNWSVDDNGTVFVEWPTEPTV